MRAVLIYEGGPSCYLSEINPYMATTPLWKDTAVSIPTGNLFRISGGSDPDGNFGGLFYQGRAVTPSGLGNASIYFNRICASRVHVNVPNFLTINTVGLVINMSFTVQRSADNGGSWSSVGSTTYFRPDWSYDPSFSGGLCSFPINDHFHPKMSFFYSVLEGTTATINARYRIGSSWTSYGFNPMTGSRTAVYPLSLVATPGIEEVNFGSLVWKTPVNCAPGALYYVNPYGGWDAFLIEGEIVEADDTERWTRRISTPNTSLTQCDERNYLSEITRRWTMHTGGLTDTESAKMWYLLQSNNVYFHDFATGTVLPVILEDATQERKTYKNTGRRIVTYTITARLAQERLRR